MNASALAELLGVELEGDGDPEIRGVAPLESATPHDLAFLARPRYLAYLDRATAGAVLIASDLVAQSQTRIPRIVVEDVHAALAELLPHLYPRSDPAPGIHQTAVIDPGVVLANDVGVGPYTVLRGGTSVGRGARIGPHCVVGDDCTIGEDVILHSHVTLYAGSRIGARSILHSGVRIGVDGFGYAQVGGAVRKIPQVGGCDIGEDVEIGANTTVDRGSIGRTEIGDRVKIDNLVHIGHNVRIGEDSIVVAQVGIAGSTRVGRGVTLAGQAGIPGHLEIGDGATVAAQAGVFGDVPAGQTYSGYPARPHKESLRMQAGLARLPQVLKRLRALEEAIRARQGNGE